MTLFETRRPAARRSSPCWPVTAGSTPPWLRTRIPIRLSCSSRGPVRAIRDRGDGSGVEPRGAITGEIPEPVAAEAEDLGTF